jgi:hypothetical protein
MLRRLEILACDKPCDRPDCLTAYHYIADRLLAGFPSMILLKNSGYSVKLFFDDNGSLLISTGFDTDCTPNWFFSTDVGLIICRA